MRRHACHSVDRLDRPIANRACVAHMLRAQWGVPSSKQVWIRNMSKFFAPVIAVFVAILSTAGMGQALMAAQSDSLPVIDAPLSKSTERASSPITSRWQQQAQACLGYGEWCGEGSCCRGFKCVKSTHEGKPWSSCEPATCEAKLDVCQTSCGPGDPTDASGKPPESWKRCFARCGEKYNC